MLWRRFFTEMRKHYYTNLKTSMVYVSVTFVVSLLLGCLADAVLPFGQWSMVIRAAILVFIALSGFILAYFGSLFLHDRKLVVDNEWVPFRARYSPRARWVLFAVVAALLGVMMNAVAHMGGQIGYTAFASVIVVAGLGLFGFVRETEAERERAEIGAPDPRDYRYHETLERRKREQEEKWQQRQRNNMVRKTRIMKGKREADAVRDQLEEGDPAEPRNQQ